MTVTKDRIGIGILSHAHGHANTYCREMLGYDDVEHMHNDTDLDNIREEKRYQRLVLRLLAKKAD